MSTAAQPLADKVVDAGDGRVISFPGSMPDEHITNFLRSSTPTQFEKDRPAMAPQDRQANSFLTGVAGGMSGLSERGGTTGEVLKNTASDIAKPPSTADAIGSSLLGPAYDVGKKAYGIGKDIFSPTGANEDPEDALERRAHGIGSVAGTAATAMAPEGFSEGRESVGGSIHTPEGKLTPGARALSSTAGMLAGGGAGHMTGIPGAGTAGGVAGYRLGPSLMERMFPEPAETAAKRTADAGYESRGKDLMRRGKEQDALDRRAQKDAKANAPEPPETEHGNPGGEVPYGSVIKLPEPNEAAPPLNPKYMASVPRKELTGMGESRTPGAGTQLQQIGNKIIYTPETGYAPPRSSETIGNMVEPPLKVSNEMGIRWAHSPDGKYSVSIPNGVPDEAVEEYARPRLAEQAKAHGGLFTQ